jgi:hypothetical protein
VSDLEYEYEPVPGLPEDLPEGERILWQGAPRWRALARRAFHVRKLVVYFTLLLGVLIAMELAAGGSFGDAMLGAGWLVALAHVSIGLLVLLAWAMSRATLYTITNRRVVLRFGVAIPITINLPFRRIAAASLREYPDGTGDIPLTMSSEARLSYLVLWPHARPWHFAPPEPMLRAIPDAARVAGILTAAVPREAAGSVAQAAANDAHGGEEMRSESAVQTM